jgi:G protein beta subunit-like protein
VFEGISKNVTCLGFYDDGRFMYSGGEDCSARIWDLRQVPGLPVVDVVDV